MEKQKETLCINCSQKIKKKVELICGHVICKECLLESTIRPILEWLTYIHRAPCSKCNRFQRLKSLELDCKCIWDEFKDAKYEKCNNKHNLTHIDYFLINDSISFDIFSSIVSNRAKTHYKNSKSKDDEVESIIETMNKKGNKDILSSFLADPKEELSPSISSDSEIEFFNKLITINKNINSIIKLGVTSLHNRAISKLLRNNKRITRLHLKDCYMENNDEHICDALKTNKTLKELSIFYISNISEILKVNKILVNLNLTGGGINSEGIKLISEALKINKVLKELWLDDNNIDDKDALAIGEMLKVNRSLKLLSLQGCEIETGGTFICEGLMNNGILEELYIKDNMIGVNGAMMISEVLKGNTNLKCLDITLNSLSNEGVRAICKALLINKSLVRLDIANNLVTVESAKDISDSIRVNKVLKELNLEFNNLGNESAIIIAEGLKINKTLEVLSVRFCSLDEKGLKALNEASALHKIDYLIDHRYKMERMWGKN